MITKNELIKIICRQFDVSDSLLEDLVKEIEKLNDRQIIKQAKKAGLNIERIRAGQFILNKIFN